MLVPVWGQWHSLKAFVGLRVGMTRVGVEIYLPLQLAE